MRYVALHCHRAAGTALRRAAARYRTEPLPHLL